MKTRMTSCSRGSLVGFLCLLVLPVWGTWAPARAEPVSERQQTILILGMAPLHGPLGRRVRELLLETTGSTVIRVTHDAPGLSSAGRIDWIEDTRQLVEQHNPDVVVMGMGQRDDTSFRHGGEALRWGTPQWARAYGSRVSTLLSVLSGRRVFWLGPPTLSAARRSTRQAYVSLVIEQVVRDTAGATFVDFFAMTADAHGQTIRGFSTGEGQSVRTRKLADGTFTRAYREHLAQGISRAILQGLSESPAP